jgi:DNA-binding protein HU-beta
MTTSAKEHRMTKPELAKRVAADAGVPAGQAASVVDAAFDVIAGELAAGRDIAIAGFGKFSVTERAAREGRNPATGQRGTQPRNRSDDPDRCQPRREVFRRRRTEAAAQQPTSAGRLARRPQRGCGPPP